MNEHSTADYEIALHPNLVNEAAINRLADLLEHFAGDLIREILLSESYED